MQFYGVCEHQLRNSSQTARHPSLVTSELRMAGQASFNTSELGIFAGALRTDILTRSRVSRILNEPSPRRAQMESTRIMSQPRPEATTSATRRSSMGHSLNLPFTTATPTTVIANQTIVCASAETIPNRLA